MYIPKLKWSVNNSASKIKHNYYIIFKILDYEISFQEFKSFICFYSLSN